MEVPFRVKDLISICHSQWLLQGRLQMTCEESWMLSWSTRVELCCRFAIRALLLNEDALLQVRNFFPGIKSLSFWKAIINVVFLGLNLKLELCNWYRLVIYRALTCVQLRPLKFFNWYNFSETCIETCFLFPFENCMYNFVLLMKK